ncbi:DUF1613 domain protein [Aspergillus steynii IBT 23096]|uniref:tRNA (uracil-O(2)-)-methyltransferase n=1 Tax=Aspergillus steynii IBT 23096 TaxID=1392250 RepID=A0A2I2G8L9_9EURO|nr:DUF1613 domain protein [Aspergillus steynii IBT 23096]PLB49229.1 DUF1613 domain protein [Aspergillus steynii IBT 23096]
MPVRNKILRDTSLLSGKPLAETLTPSKVLATPSEEWVTSPDLAEPRLPYIPEIMEDVTVYLLSNINVNSSHLFRADILHDSLGLLKTPWQKERDHAPGSGAQPEPEAAEETVDPLPARDVPGFELTRTVVRRFIPRNPQLDRELDQTCHLYDRMQGRDGEEDLPASRDVLVVYTPHATSKEDTPYYHPQIRALAILYQFEYKNTETTEAEETPPGSGTLSLHFLPFADEEISNRLERTFSALINTQIRLARGTRLSNTPGKSNGEGQSRGGGEGRGGGDKPNKDNIIPQHLVQNTYSRLKMKYGPSLCRDWVESTEPSKHVFEDLSITAFLIELWRSMYGVCPADERSQENGSSSNAGANPRPSFPGFVDIACGNGVLVYVLLMEGYEGWGFDARRRKTWSIFPPMVQSQLREGLYIPKPFSESIRGGSSADCEPADADLDLDLNIGLKSHTGIYRPNTFIISNHADELTVWTPLMGALSSPASPLPFLAIPCCSHALSGSKHRYPPPKPNPQTQTQTQQDDPNPNAEEGEDPNTDAHGSLASLRKAKLSSQPGATGFYKSTYGALTAKTMSMAQEIGYGVESTMLRIPSTRNMGVIGGREAVTREWRVRRERLRLGSKANADSKADSNGAETVAKVMDVVNRECLRDGGVRAAADIWVERARGIVAGPGRGKEVGFSEGH